MNKPIDPALLRSSQAFADHLANRGLRLDPASEARAAEAGARVGISRPHESAHLHVAGAAPYIDDLPELAGTLHAALGLSPVAHGRITATHLDRIRARPGVVAVLSALPKRNCWSMAFLAMLLYQGNQYSLESCSLGRPINSE